MPTKTGPEEDAFIFRFGGGQNSSASEDEIDVREASSGQNYILDLKNSSLRNRGPFDKLGTTPNTSEIRGFANLLKSDGTVSMLVQSGTEVYEWDGSSFSTSKATVSSSAKLRGPLSQNWQLTDKVIITDLNLAQPVMEWDGTTLQNVTFTDETISGSFGTFRARYCVVDNERAIFSNVHDNGSDFPHLIIGSQRGDFTIITTANRPSSSLSEEDPFFLVQPDNYYINGMVQAFDTVVTSSKLGSLFKLSGSSAKDFSFKSFFPRSGASGDEAVTFVGSDIFYGRQGRLESVIATDEFGDVENNDLTIPISDKIAAYENWILIYNQRNQRVYCFPENQAEAWIYFKPLANSKLSPWVKWTSQHATSFQPTAVMSMLDPSDNLEYVFFGDSSGNLYRMEGSGSSGDSGTSNIRTLRASPVLRTQLNHISSQVEGWILYRSADEVDISLTILYNGENVFDESLNITLPITTERKVYNAGSYYSNQIYYSQSLNGRLTRENFYAGSGSGEIQVKIEYNGTKDINIQEVGFRFEKTT